jgi:hypothetical protein
MPAVACYTIVLGHKVKTPKWPDHFSFKLPISAILSRRSILYFTLKVSAGVMYLKIVVNRKSVGTYTFPGVWYGTVVKVVPGKRLRHGKNTVRFEVSGDKGGSLYGGDPFSARLENTVLLWQKNDKVDETP